MNKLELARQLAKQMAEREQSTGQDNLQMEEQVTDLIGGDSADFTNWAGQSEKIKGTGRETIPGREGSLEAGQDADTLYRDTFDTLYHDNFIPGIEISDDVDDEAIYGKNRRRQRNNGGYGR